jgi:hypothetical protein
VSGLGEVTAISAGEYHVCALQAPGGVFCWGNNSEGQLGDGTHTERHIPVPVSGLSDAVAISAGGFHTCALRASGQVVCWGENSAGELGDGTRLRRDIPVPVVGLSDAIAISAGTSHTCALRASGEMVCWGWNKFGQLGDGTQRERLVPTPVAAASGSGNRRSGRERVRRCGNFARQVAFAITAQGLGCRRARHVVRRWKRTLWYRNGSGRVYGFYCRYREPGNGMRPIVRCAGADGRRLRWRTRSIYGG